MAKKCEAIEKNNSDSTKVVMKNIIESAGGNPDLPGPEYIEELGSKNFFQEGIFRRVNYLIENRETEILEALYPNNNIKLPNKLEQDNPEHIELCDVIVESLYRFAGIDPEENTVSSWVKGSHCAESKSRHKVFKLCFALKMNESETNEFFQKCYFERAFNFKNIDEALFFFCMKNGHDYNYVKLLKDKITVAAHETNQTDSNNNYTYEIGSEIERMAEVDLIDFLAKNKISFENQNVSAKKEIKQLLDECLALAEEIDGYDYDKELETEAEENKVGDVRSKKKKKSTYKRKITRPTLFKLIYGIDFKKTSGVEFREKKDGSGTTKQGIAVYKRLLSLSKFSSLVKTNFPSSDILNKLLNENNKGKVSYDAIRKTIIMLAFYSYFAEYQLYPERYRSEDPKILGDDFVTYVNGCLNRSGYLQMYPKNPYDWMIMYCAYSLLSLERLCEFVEEYIVYDYL